MDLNKQQMQGNQKGESVTTVGKARIHCCSGKLLSQKN